VSLDCEALLSAIEASSSRGHDTKGEIAPGVHQTVAYYRAVEIARREGRTLLLILRYLSLI
jgi:hypothetical protein